MPQVYAFLNNLFLLMHVSILYGHNWLEILVDSNYGHIICTVLLDFFFKVTTLFIVTNMLTMWSCLSKLHFVYGIQGVQYIACTISIY